MAEFDRAQLRQWAVRGAEQRLQEIAAEAAAIHRAFPELRDRGRAGSGSCHGGDCGEGPAARPRKHVCGTAQGGQRADAEVLGSASRERRRRDIRRQREGGGSATGKDRGGKTHARSAEDVCRGTQADQRRTEKTLGRATPRQRLSTCGRLSHHGQPPCAPASPHSSIAPAVAPQRSRSPAIKLPECRWRSSDHSGGASRSRSFRSSFPSSTSAPPSPP